MLQESVSTTETSLNQDNGIWSPALRMLTIGLTVVVSSAAFEALAVATILPETVRELGGLEYYGLAFSAFTLAQLIGITVAGSEADRRGPTMPFVVGVALFVAGLLIGGFAPSMPVLIAARTLQGLGGGFVSSISYVAIGRGYPSEAKAKMLAILASAWVIPGLAGPALAGAIAEHTGWRTVFFGIVPLPLIAAVLAFPALRRLGGGTGVPRDWRRLGAALQLAIGAGLLLSGLTMRPWWLALLVAVGGLLIGLPGFRRLMPAGTLSGQPGLPAAVAVAALLNMAFFGVDAFVPLMLQEGRGQSVAFAGLALTAATISWTTGAWLQAHYAPSSNRRVLVLIGLLILAVSILGVGLAAFPWLPAWSALLTWAVAGLGMGIAFSTISLVVLEQAPAGAEGVATSAMQLANMIGTAFGTGIGGAIIGTAVGNPANLIALQNGLMVLVIILSIWVARRLPGVAPAAKGV